jgi:hypothetical protein
VLFLVRTLIPFIRALTAPSLRLRPHVPLVYQEFQKTEEDEIGENDEDRQEGNLPAVHGGCIGALVVDLV